jgi:hemerythrin
MADKRTSAGESKAADWISWDQTLKIGHARMDADHEALAELFNLLPRAVAQRKGKHYCA